MEQSFTLRLQTQPFIHVTSMYQVLDTRLWWQKDEYEKFPLCGSLHLVGEMDKY